jgi:peptidoglycan/LPS O-acetylase OafA/YrhL
MGVLLAFMLNARRGYGLAVRALGNPWTFGAITLGLACWFLFWPLGHESALNTELLNLVVTLFVGALVLRSGAPILTFTPVMYVGKISYGIYLMHMLVLVCLVHAFGKSAPFMVFAVGSLLTIMAASLSWRYFESRIISFYKQRFSPLNRGRPVPLQTTLSPKPIA